MGTWQSFCLIAGLLMQHMRQLSGRNSFIHLPQVLNVCVRHLPLEREP